MIFDNVKLLGYTHQNTLLGENSSQINGRRTLTIVGFILDLQNTNGGEKVFKDVRTLQQVCKDFQPVFINGENYGQGKVKSFSVDSGNWVRTTEYRMEVEVFVETNIESFIKPGDPNFTGITNDLTGLNEKGYLNLIKDIQETFQIDFDANSKVVSGSQTIDLEIDTFTELFNSDLLSSIAFLIARVLLKTLPQNVSEANYTARSAFTVLGEDKFDLINGKFTFVRKFGYKLTNASSIPEVSTDIIHSITLDQNGISQVTERGTIKAESNYRIENGVKKFKFPLKTLGDAFNQLAASSFSRCQTFYNTYQSSVLYYLNGDYYNLNSQPISKSSAIDKFNYQLEYTITYTDDQRIKNTYYSEYTVEISKNENLWQISQNGLVEGINSVNYSRYKLAENGWAIVRPAMVTLNDPNNPIRKLYLSVDNTNTHHISDLKEISRTFKKNEYLGNISYTYTWSNDPNIIVNDPNNIVKKTIIINSDGHDGDPRLSREFIVPYNTYTLRQDLNLDDLSTLDITLKYQIKEKNSMGTFFNGLDYFDALKSELNNRANNNVAQNKRFLENVNFQSNESSEVELKGIYKFVSSI